MTETSETEILKAACCVAGVDDDVCRKELPLLKKLAARVGVPVKTLTLWIDQAQSDTQYYEQQFKKIKADRDRTVKVLFLVAMADGFITEDEKSVIRHLSRKLGINEQRFRKIHRAATKQLGGIELRGVKASA